MSPTEDELRAALHDGEGDAPNAERIIGNVVRMRARRRSRALSTAASVAIVAALGGGGAWVLHNGAANEEAGSNATQYENGAAAGGASAPRAAIRSTVTASGTTAGSKAAQPQSRSAAFSCAGSPPRVLAPGGTSTTSGAGKLFSAPVATVVVCAYSERSGRPQPLIFTGTQAQTIVTSLESSPSVRPGGMCPTYRVAGERTAELIGVTADDGVAGRVTATLDRPACATIATNGSFVRYGWRPPTPLLTAISRQLPVGAAAPPTK